MSYEYEAGKMYRMPPHFGPTPGPRQNLEPFTPDHVNFPKRHSAMVTYLTRKEQLERIIPPGFTVWGEPLVMIEQLYMTEIQWLAGRGYAISGIKAPLRYVGKNRTIHGLFQLVLWENMTDPIITGREEVGAPKLYADIPDPRTLNSRHSYEAGWGGTRFFEMELSDLKETAANPPAFEVDGVKSDGVIYYKYYPKTFKSGTPDIEYATLSPAAGNMGTNSKRYAGKGKVRYIPTTFEQIPTMYHIINKLAALDLLEVRSATLTFGQGGRDYADTEIVT